MGIAVGIDLGTTNSAVAWVDTRGQAVVLPNAEGKNITPSVVALKDGQILVGEPAKELQALGDPHVAAFFKRYMGDDFYGFHAQGRDYRAVELSAHVLSTLKRDAETALGQPVTDAVITVPAYFRNPQREATIAAGTRAGLNVLQVVNEPTAAAIAYGVKAADRDQTLLVYDLGGGTFDVTLLRLTGDEIRILTSNGDHHLGGRDWDDRILRYLAAQFETEHGVDPLADAETINDLLVLAEDVKKRLSQAQSATVPVVAAGTRGRVTLDRATFQEMTGDLMLRTISLTDEVLESQGLARSAVDGVLLVGGSTRMPMVHDWVRQAFGKPPLVGVHVDEAVALGAARLAAQQARSAGDDGPLMLGGRRAVDVTNHSLGMIAIKEDRSAYINSLILPKNLALPCAQSRPYQCRVRRGSTGTVEVFMTQGESGHPGSATYLGKYVIDGVPDGGSGKAVVDVTYSYDVSGTVQVRAQARGSGQLLPVRVEPLPPDVPQRFLQPPGAEPVVEHVTILLAFDLSGSMYGEPLRQAQQAARSFMAQVDLANSSVGILGVADRCMVAVKACQDAKAILDGIDRLPALPVGVGNDAHPFDTALAELRHVRGRRCIVTLADGQWYNPERAIAAARTCRAAGIESIAIGFGSADRAFLAAIASSDEASFFTSLDKLTETFESIAQEMTELDAAPQPAGQRRSMLAFWR